MKQNTSLANQLLIAMPSMHEGHFSHSVIYVCEHNDQGAVGLIINQPMEFPLQLVYEKLQIESPHHSSTLPLLFGGPVQPERGFVIHRGKGQWRSSLMLADDVTVTTSSDIIRAIANDSGPKEVLIALGYAGWDSLQLDEEILANQWLVCPYQSEILYEVPFENRWQYALNSIGVNPQQLYLGFGHA